MKIDETPYQFAQNPMAAIEKLRRQTPSTGWDSIDLSFLELLAGLPQADRVIEEAIATLEAGTGDIKPGKSNESGESSKDKRHLSVVSDIKPVAPEEDPVKSVESAMTLLNHELSADDIQYLKQIVIPGLPILLGQVPAQQIFPATANGSLNYKGFDVSNKLSELIETGYKTGKPIRVELDNNSSVVLKIRDGKVSAEFLSNDQAMTLYLRNELDELHRRMQARNLPVGTFSYREDTGGGKQKRHSSPDEGNA